jgi:hypothetical protein
MAWHKPDPPVVWRAIAAYLAFAYDGPAAAGGLPTGTPSAVRARLDSLRRTDTSDFYNSSVFERDTTTTGAAGSTAAAAGSSGPARYALRLGNKHYPHMKLVIERAPAGQGHLFRADTHDAHVRPAPGTRDYHIFCQLMEKNRETAEKIEADWEAAGIPTFKSYLRDDLARRKAEQ